ncbi:MULTISPECIES: MarR family winged helix-turn-helix transcriptional regulator [Amycolatopsis]|uniref:MarR family winged helix-turn-helix transcriptional regulator n=1 Tax=Amycolatopsis albidoflavus TaxID=102226 RepID=A0ABW5HUP3_9PSEU
MSRDPDLLDPRETRVWRSFVQFSGKAVAAVERDLFAARGLSGADFQILARLHEAEDKQLSQKLLGELTGWTATRLSHQLARMHGRGLVDRAAAGRGRLMRISLTEAGLHTYESALPAYARAVREHFLGGAALAELEEGLRLLGAPRLDGRAG